MDARPNGEERGGLAPATWRWTRRLALALLVGSLGLELALRLVGTAAVDGRLAAALASFDRQLPWEVADHGDSAKDEAFAHPFLGYETVERHEQLTGQLAFLADLGPAREAWEAQHFVVLLVGGSVARFVGDPSVGGLDAMGAELRGLPALGGREPYFLSAGRQAFKQPQQLLLVGYLATLGIEPDAVVNLDGFNEVALGSSNLDYGLHPIWPSHYHAAHLGGLDVRSAPQVEATARLWNLADRARHIGRRARSAPLSWSVLARFVAAWRIERLADAAERARADFRSARAADDGWRQSEALPAPPGSELGLTQCVDVWRRGSLALAALCEGRGIAYLHVLQPALGHDGSKVPAPEEVAILAAAEAETGWAAAALAGVRAGYPRLRAAGAELAASGVAFVDATDVFAARTDAIYYDLCHFHRPGTELVGERIGAGLAELLSKRQSR
ncbi:hypothetical protein [Engelhardtia mirabilis]|uniref:Uncharacterized protein n=1 Tax=Engelhardtia mirabilis TaxID=2528011 RepID=A0A518BHH4_9BACT|nr:hypothetical protein Pla133_15050 [Planctomycetes bacterium Pla133]QDV00758.1 hypothetical protein Pla86_15040 [Planctomycetes bacterium Pla86]